MFVSYATTIVVFFKAQYCAAFEHVYKLPFVQIMSSEHAHLKSAVGSCDKKHDSEARWCSEFEQLVASSTISGFALLTAKGVSEPIVGPFCAAFDSKVGMDLQQAFAQQACTHAHHCYAHRSVFYTHVCAG